MALADAHNIHSRLIVLQPAAANANAIYLGGPAVSATDYAIRIPAPVGGLPPAPVQLGEFNTGAIVPAEIYAIGTATEVLQIGYVPY
jgi:hypothetical protein